jgi:nitrate reductase NapAB chaperone NapD
MTIEIVIDLNQAGLTLDPAELEAYSLRLVEELRSDLAEDAHLIREDELPEGAMSGAAAFISGILKADVNPKNIGKVLGWLWNLRPTAVQKITYKKEGVEVVLEYQRPDQLNQQIEALKQIDGLLTVQLIQTK